MYVHVVHERLIEAPPGEVFAELEALGTAGDRIWPSRSMPFVRTPGAMEVGVTRERHGPTRAVLDGYEPERSIVWRAEVPFLDGTHSFRLSPTEGGATRVAHDLEIDTRWWFSPVWRLSMGQAHDRIVGALLDRLERCAGTPAR